jgi:hypothetical protein
VYAKAFSCSGTDRLEDNQPSCAQAHYKCDPESDPPPLRSGFDPLTLTSSTPYLISPSLPFRIRLSALFPIRINLQLWNIIDNW